MNIFSNVVDRQYTITSKKTAWVALKNGYCPFGREGVNRTQLHRFVLPYRQISKPGIVQIFEDGE